MARKKDIDEREVSKNLLKLQLTTGYFDVQNFAKLLDRVLVYELWREPITTETGEVVKYESFLDFIQTPPPKGLGTNFEAIWRICSDDPVLLDLLDRAVQREPGSPGKNHSIAAEVNDNKSDKLKRPSGTSKQAGLRQLRKKNPELHAKVLTGELTVNAAMVQAGLRLKQVTIFVNPERASQKLRQTFNTEDFVELVALLMSDLPEQKEIVVEKIKQTLDKKQINKIKDYLASL